MPAGRTRRTAARIRPTSSRQPAAALAVALDVARRLSEQERVELAVASATRSADPAHAIRWTDDGLWQGNAGLAVLYGALDACEPGEGWDRIGREKLRVATAAIEGRRAVPLGLARGLAGLGIAAWTLSRGGTRYARLRATLDEALAVRARVTADELVRRRSHGVSVATFDVISGLTGVGRYLLLRRDVPACRRALESVARCLVYLSEEDGNGVPHCHTAADRQVNVGLAHGLPGPLALLSLAALQGVEEAGQLEAVERLAERVLDARVDDEWGINFPTAVAIEDARDKPRPTRAAWCYGTPGIARALWLAGVAAGRADHCEVAVTALEAVHRRPIAARRIDSPTFCHGVAGLLQVTLRFAHDTGGEVFDDASRTLVGRLLDAYEPDSLLGYRSTEPSGTRLDQPGLLDGAAGVALVLLAAATPAEPAWDAAFLLS